MSYRIPIVFTGFIYFFRAFPVFCFSLRLFVFDIRLMVKLSEEIVRIIFFLKIIQEGKFIILLGINDVGFGGEIEIFKKVVALIFNKLLALTDDTFWFIKENG